MEASRAEDSLKEEEEEVLEGRTPGGRCWGHTGANLLARSVSFQGATVTGGMNLQHRQCYSPAIHEEA